MRDTRTLILVPAVLLVCAISGEARQGEAQRIAAPSPQSPQAEPKTKGADATGIPECDKYFSMVDACVASKKMPKEEQQAAELNVTRLRTMLPIAASPQGRATLVQRCSASIASAQKSDKAGCFKTEEKASK